MAAWIDRMVKRGLIERDPHARDRRALHIRLTEAGRALVQRATAAICQAEADALSGLSPAERMMLTELLRKVGAGRRAR
jgi:DNA-binding MarR family transcriptional regulator